MCLHHFILPLYDSLQITILYTPNKRWSRHKRATLTPCEPNTCIILSTHPLQPRSTCVSQLPSAVISTAGRPLGSPSLHITILYALNKCSRRRRANSMPCELIEHLYYTPYTHP